MTADDEALAVTRTRLLEAALPLAAMHGWSDDVLAEAAVMADLPADTPLAAFPGGVGDALAFWSAETDRRVEAAMADLPLDHMPIDERIGLVIRLRLEPLNDHRQAVQRAMAFLALPPHGWLARRLTWETVTSMAYAAGDRSTDIRYYAVRAAIAAVYGPTLLYWFSDTSDGCDDTWAFLGRTVAAATIAPRLKDVGNALLRRLSGGRLGVPGQPQPQQSTHAASE